MRRILPSRQLLTRLGIAIICAALLCSTSLTLADNRFGHFKGQIITSWLSDGRNMRLESPFGYVDPAGLEWNVPAGAETDGASVPQVLWVLYAPFTGKYRTAAVIHDYYCQVKSRPWEATHKVFYFAMRASGVDERTAKVMYGAVYFLGPRWGIGTASRGPGADKYASLEQQKKVVENLDHWIARTNPGLDEIDRRLETGTLSDR